MITDLSKEEKRVISALKRIEKIWPKTLWIFAASGEFVVMRSDEGGGHKFKNDGVDHDFVVDQINIPCDGGDW